MSGLHSAAGSRRQNPRARCVIGSAAVASPPGIAGVARAALWLHRIPGWFI